MKVKDLTGLTAAEVAGKLADLEEEQFNLRFQAKMGQLANPLQLRMVRRDIARAKTVLAQKQAEAK